MATPCGSLEAGLLLAQGNLPAALHWVQQSGLHAGDTPEYGRAGEYLLLARVLVAENKPSEALALLARLLQVVQTAGAGDWEVRVQVLQAVALQRQGSLELALSALERALILAEPEGFVRAFAGEGPAMASLLREAAARGICPGYVTRLLAALVAEAAQPAAVGGDHPSFRRPLSDERRQEMLQPTAIALPEALSEREVGILRLIADGLLNDEIARQLYLSLSTVKWHTSNIYGKLGVESRTQAVARARALGIFPEGPS